MSAALVVLIGAPGSGKSTVGRLLSERLGSAFVDSDEEFARIVGQSLGSYLITHGVQASAQREAEVAVKLLCSAQGVLALGSAAPLSPQVQQALVPHTVVFLDVDGPRAARRKSLTAVIPGVFTSMRSTLMNQLTERRPIYESLADLSVDTVDRTAPEVVAAIVAWFA